MSTLAVTNTFVSGAVITASSHNQNFSDVIAWANGNIDQENLDTMSGPIEWNVTTNELALDITNVGTEGSFNIEHNGILASSKSAVSITSTAAQSTGVALVNLAASSSSNALPVLKITDAGAGGVALQVVSTTKPSHPCPSMTTVQRDALSSVSTGDEIWNTTNHRKEVYQSNGWVGVATDHGYSAQIDNLSLAAAVATSALTVSAKGIDGNALSASNVAKICFRSATAATGTSTQVKAASIADLVVDSGSTLGHKSAAASYIYVYALNNAGAVELAVSSALFDEGSRVSTTAVGSTGVADSATTMYSTTARTDVACRLLGRLKSTQATAGTWDSAISEISLAPFATRSLTEHSVVAHTPGGHGSTGTAIRRYGSAVTVGTAITYASNPSNNGDTFTINEAGLYFAVISDGTAGTTTRIGISKNASSLTDNIDVLDPSEILASTGTISGLYSSCSGMAWCVPGDVLRAHTNTGPTNTGSKDMIRIVKVV